MKERTNERLTAGLRRIVERADEASGRLSGSEAQLVGLVRRGLAFRHARPPRAYFLTPAGHRLRQDFLSATPPPPAPVTDAGSGVFRARTGAEPWTAGPHREREVRSAWQGLVELRRMTNTDGATERPCGWERTHLAQAAALALEAAGCRPAGGAGGTGGGYAVAETPQPEAVAVRLSAGAEGEIRACSEALERAGWQVSEHAGRGGQAGRWLLASPRRV
ncbi:hypothetical protein [Streptomyces sp. NBC_01304]|uniref:hypothetical protein n=1 Tax=Streptomyces sp. NBC_01304 TaxID=2903818 RepID=UPI002E1534AF|nr:hypothetical protein OG430_11625 [Streptomyces sp. NBC_01304]